MRVPLLLALSLAIGRSGDQPRSRVVVQCKSKKIVVPVTHPATTVKSFIALVNKKCAKVADGKKHAQTVVELTFGGAVLGEEDELLDIVDDMNVLEAVFGATEPDEVQSCDFDIVKASEMTKTRFEKDYLGKKPFMVTFEGGASDWTPEPRLWAPDALAQRHGNKFAVGGYSEILVTLKGQGYDKYKLKDFVAEHWHSNARNGDGGEAMYLVDPVLFSKLKDISTTLQLPDYIMTARDPKKWGDLFFLGKKNSSVAFHMHSDSWSATAIGEKEWYVYPPTHHPLMRGRAIPGGIPNAYDQISWVEKVLPRLAENDRPLRCTQRAGDLLYIPELWFHGVVNTKDTVSVAFQGKTALLRDQANSYSGGDLVESVLGFAEGSAEQNLASLEAILRRMEGATGASAFYHSMMAQRYSFWGSEHELHREDWPAKARQHLAKAVELNPFDALSLANLGSAIQNSGDTVEARKLLETAHSLSPRNTDVLTAFVKVLGAGEPDLKVTQELFEQAKQERRYSKGRGKVILGQIFASFGIGDP